MATYIHPFTFFPTKTRTKTPFPHPPRPNFFVFASKEEESSLDYQKKNGQLADVNLVRRPVPKKGIKFNTDPTPIKSSTFRRKKVLIDGHNFQETKPTTNTKPTTTLIPNVILRKPNSAFPEDDIDVNQSSRRLKLQSNLLLRMGKDKDKVKENFSDITLLKKPQPVISLPDDDIDSNEKTSSTTTVTATAAESVGENSFPVMSISIQEKPSFDVSSTGSTESDADQITSDESVPQEPEPDYEAMIEAALQGKPQRLEQSKEEKYQFFKLDMARMINNSYDSNEKLIAEAPLQEREGADWTRAENLFNTGERVEVELISCSSRGFVGSFGSLIGFLPYRNLGAKWKFLAFESWVRQKGLDPSIYKQNLGIIGVYELQKKNLNLDSKLIREKVDGQLSPDMKLEDLLILYDQEKTKFLASFVGQKVKVNVVLADRNSRRLMFSGRPKQNQELVEKKRSLMARLSVGDVVKCCIQKITYFGIFVEVEGVPALIHQSEVSWDTTLDPSSFLKIGQIVEAKVHQLDFALERIQLSLKEITPDPLIEALESVVGERNSLDGRLDTSQADVQWDDVESLIKQLQQIEEVQSVSKGRFFLSPGLAPTFQVYMASMFENRYKLLARSGNKVQEVMVEASLDREEMKAAILTCTNRVE